MQSINLYLNEISKAMLIFVYLLGLVVLFVTELGPVVVTKACSLVVNPDIENTLFLAVWAIFGGRTCNIPQSRYYTYTASPCIQRVFEQFGFL